MAHSRAELLDNIKTALKECGAAGSAGFLTAVKHFLNALGYGSDRTHELSGEPAEFFREFPAPNPDTKSERRFLDAAKSARIVFQFGEEEIAATENMFDGAKFDDGDAKSFLFAAAELKKSGHARGQYAQFAREINKRFNCPVVVLFRTPDRRMTFAFVGRRRHKIDDSRDVLEKVSLLREIDCENPHRGHLNILAELPLAARREWMRKNGKEQNFDGLLAAWLDELDAEALNKRFYKELFGWFGRAVRAAKFPLDGTTMEDQIIRLITRLLFVWFVKEKRLVAEELFVEKQIMPLLAPCAKGDSYYRAVLQNLFFATLNTEIGKRGFSAQTNATHRNFYRYRYKSLMARPDKILALMKTTPFINGGLFDCMDAEEGGGGRPDMFSDPDPKTHPAARKKAFAALSVPDSLFFGEDGLIPIFCKYKFTVEENTPVEQEVALDPELLGKVFENLLAAYNPETRDNVRKQTGSYYTPREIVDYMAAESLAECLANKTAPQGADKKQWREKVRDLLDYAKPECGIADEDKPALVRAIAEIKIFDPACGSGAFLMGALHMLSMALCKLDPANREWKKLQKGRAANAAAAAFDEKDKAARAARLAEINETFTKYSTDFGRKLFLIQNSVFGADIQPVACQIAKLRFFISLAIEQTPDANAENFGIKPLPNLETRFAAADTLIKINRLEKGQGNIGDEKIIGIKSEINANRERHFNAAGRGEKLACRATDRKLRGALANALKGVFLEDREAEKIARWNPYDQNARAEWFDAEYMFGVRDGFDVVIGNPPYVKTEHLSEEQKSRLKRDFGWCDDLYAHFIFQAAHFACDGGVFSFITNDSFVGFKSKERIRNLFLENRLLTLVKCPGITFDATIYTAVFSVVKTAPAAGHEYKSGEITETEYEYQKLGEVDYESVAAMPGNRLLYASPMLRVYQQISSRHKKVKDFLSVLDAGIHSGNVRQKIFFAVKGKRADLRRLLQGKQISRYALTWDSPNAQYKFCDIEYVPLPQPGIGRQGSPSKQNEWWSLSDIENHHQPERLLMRQTSDCIVAAYHNEAELGRFYTDNTLFTVLPKSDKINLKYAMAVFNSALFNALYRFVAQEDGKALAQVKIGVVKELPFVLLTKSAQNKIAECAQKITAAKAANPAADTSEWEAEIDNRVCALYNLTETERKIVEGG